MNFTEKDLSQIKSLGIDADEVEQQLERFINGFPDLELCDTVAENHGLKKLSAEEVSGNLAFYEAHSGTKKLVKFVPASGAASRMFKMLFNYLEGGITLEDEGARQFFSECENFAFAEELLALAGDAETAKTMLAKGDPKIVEWLLTETGLNYGFLPKALLSFHQYNDGSIRKAIDEHLVEGAQYSADANGDVKLHFTVSQDHMELVKAHLDRVVPQFEARFSVSYEISFSVQDKATDTLAVDLENNPFRLDDGSLLFRPGGHGALLKNLDAIEGDVVFIKNIDNVAAEWLIGDTLNYKKALGGVLLQTQEKVFAYCNALENATSLDAGFENEIVAFLANALGYKVPETFAGLGEKEKVETLLGKLNRPIRVCGVVEASGTGGGPFWVKEKNGAESLQLVETAQINLNKESQTKILGASQYANITDLVCGVKNYKGEQFDLMQFRDPDTGFIAEKSQGGKALKAMELPGLWNGAMSDWNTMFVVVPMSTFNPVKTVLDLLKKEHQGQQ